MCFPNVYDFIFIFQNWKLVYSFESLSLKPIQGNGVVYLIVLASHGPQGPLLFEVWVFERCDHGQHLKDKPQSHAMGLITKKIQYGWLIVVIGNLKILQHNYDLE